MSGKRATCSVSCRFISLSHMMLSLLFLIQKQALNSTPLPCVSPGGMKLNACYPAPEGAGSAQYSSVKRYVRKKKYVMKVQSAGFLPLERTPGCGQVDFGEFLYYDAGGQEQKGYALTISFPHSNMGYTQAFPSQNQECLLEGMKRIFEHMGGVPPRLRFDNMTTAVAQVLRGTERSLTEGFSRFMLHYRFQAEFCNPASGNEKGNVENKVGYSRRNAFVPVPTITSFEKFNEEYLWGWCEKDAQRDHYIHKIPIRELWQADADALLNLPDYPFSVFRYPEIRSVPQLPVGFSLLPAWL